MIDELCNIFKTACTYKNVNKYNTIKMRNIKKGIKLPDAIYYRFSYCNISSTKELIKSEINYNNKTNFTRQAYEAKEQNISIRFYSNLLKEVNKLYNNKYNNNEETVKTISIDGVYNRNNAYKEVLNMGFFDINNELPMDLKPYGQLNKNNEIKSAINFIENNLDMFKSTIIVCDRAYFCYDFFDFLIKNDINFVIRARKEATNLDSNVPLKKGTAKYKLIKRLRDDIKIVKSRKLLKSTVYGGKGKKKVRKYKLSIRDDCVLVTNLKDDIYSNDDIIKLYQSRWDIEVFFKYLKNNFKFQQLEEKDQKNIKKMYICELIITYIVKLIEKYASSDINKKENEKVNKTHLTTNVFKYLLQSIIKGNVTIAKIKNFCKTCIVKCNNKPNRHFPRFSKRPFSKWYIKCYSIQTSYNKIINAVINGTTDKLNKNQKLIANRIVSINGKTYG
jgi:hypothetical protein